MWIRTCVARAFCVVVTSGVVSTPDPASAGETDRHPGLERPGPAAMEMARSPLVKGKWGFLLDRLSRGQVRTWRAIEEVVAASDGSGQPRSPTLRRLWEWARTSAHVLHVEMVPASSVPTGIAGIFRVEHVDPEGLSHVAVIRLCLENIRYAVVGPRPGSDDSFVRFEGLSDVERYAEVLAHELAHAEYALESSERLGRLEASKGATEEYLSGTERVLDRLPLELQQRLRKSRAVLARTEAHAESVEALVLGELAVERPSRTGRGRKGPIRGAR